MKMLMSLIEELITREKVVRMAIISLHVNVKTPFYIIQNLGKFLRLSWGRGKRDL